jgi:integrase
MVIAQNVVAKLFVEIAMIERANYKMMQKHLEYLSEVMQLSPASLTRYRFYLRHFLLWAGEKDFNHLQKIRPTFPVYLSELPGRNGKGNLAGPTQKKILDTSKRLLRWAKSAYTKEHHNLSTDYIETLRLVRRPQLIAENIFVSEEEVKRLISFTAKETDLALIRDQAAASMLFLSGIRGSAFTTLPISAVDLENLTIRQWPELGVHTKNSKRATTFLLNIPELLVAVRRWDGIIRTVLPDTTPWYTPISHCWGEQSLSNEEPGKNRLTALEKRLKLLFLLVDLQYKSPHKFRHGHAVYGLLHAQTMADYKAVSMNLMHDSIEITDSTYAPMLSSDVQERIVGLSKKNDSTQDQYASHAGDELESYLTSLNQDKLKQALLLIAGRFAQ